MIYKPKTRQQKVNRPEPRCKAGGCLMDASKPPQCKFVTKRWRQGMSSVETTEVIKMVKVTCEKCHRTTWMPEQELQALAEQRQVQQRGQYLGDLIAARAKAEANVNKVEQTNKELNGHA